MIVKCDDATTPRPAPRTVCCSKVLAVRLIVNFSYDRFIKILRAVYS